MVFSLFGVSNKKNKDKKIPSKKVKNSFGKETNDLKKESEVKKTTSNVKNNTNKQKMVIKNRTGNYLIASPDKVESFKKYKGKIVSADEQILKLPEEQQEIVAILENGIMLIDKNKKNDAKIQVIENIARKNKFEIKQKYLVDLSIINHLYDSFKKRNINLNNTDTSSWEKAVLNLIDKAAQKGASDIHIVVENNVTKFNFRLGGFLTEIEENSSEWGKRILRTALTMADKADQATDSPTKYIGARISSVTQPLPEGVQALRLQYNPLGGAFEDRNLVIRLLSEQRVGESSDIDSLGYSKQHVELIREMRRYPTGLFIISGPTGSGKSTTLQRNLTNLLREINYRKKLYTIEDPPEYIIEGAVQLPVLGGDNEEERNEEFRKVISAALRSDPDYIMIGEIRDGASAKLGIKAAETGHGVWGSLHTNTAIGVIDRLLSEGVESHKLCDPEITKGLIGQRLGLELCPHCKIPYEEHKDNENIVPDYIKKDIEKILGNDISSLRLPNPKGCKHCADNIMPGYSRQRTVLAETILTNEEFFDIYINKGKIEAKKYWLNELNGSTMLEHALQKMYKGILSPNDINNINNMRDFDISRKDKVFKELIKYV